MRLTFRGDLNTRPTLAITNSENKWFPMISLIGKDPDAGRDWGQEEKGTTEDEMA